MITKDIPSVGTDAQLQNEAAATNSAGVLSGLLWATDLSAAKDEALPWLRQGYLARGQVALLTSLWKSGKTTLVSVLLARLQNGGGRGQGRRDHRGRPRQLAFALSPTGSGQSGRLFVPALSRQTEPGRFGCLLCGFSIFPGFFPFPRILG